MTITIREAGELLSEHLEYQFNGRPKWLQSVGVAEDRLIIYLRWNKHPAIIKKWIRWPVESIYVGEVRPA